jgi:hypothetical protein
MLHKRSAQQGPLLRPGKIKKQKEAKKSDGAAATYPKKKEWPRKSGRENRAEKIGRDMFVTTDDGKKLTTGSMVAIHEVVERFVASTVAEMSYVVKRDFGRIFVTSDVHADFA